ncbi:NUDIX domain-containing protein [Micromonospora sp. WMMA1363]|uniref:NUDIX domain-containing protein n=1 Tax=Micromonospora sp. WMMA1363 TaxID=3053985 RepID=UPI00259CF691|nr:NUDIX domain-containing protein [Micromonospora sp. WMMA1363]MDM4720866.1 NUDIX domain-containing protein [Micromonospora sp. WMMA1363]
MTPRTYTHPSVLEGIAAGASWADSTMDPTVIDWTERQRRAAIPFAVVDGRPVAPAPPTGIRYGRNRLGHWGEAQAADAIVTARDIDGVRCLLLIERGDGFGWALPGGHVDPGEIPTAAAFRELTEETGLVANPTDPWVWTLPPRYVPDPRASDEAWMVTTPVWIDLGSGWLHLPDVTGQDDARRAAWLPADTYDCLLTHLDGLYSGQVFSAHRELIADILNH